MSAVVDGDPERRLPPGLALAWGIVPATNRRGPKPAHSVDRILEAAMTVADAEGFAALSMPRIAKQVGFTANALYRYVSSRDELLVLLSDAAWGAPPDTVAEAGSWRAAAADWVRAVIDRYRARPWLLDIPVQGAPVTPNVLRWLEVLLAALAGTGLDESDTLSCALLLDGYTRSTATLIRDIGESDAPPVQSAAVMEFLQPLLRDRGYPVLADMLAGGTYQDNLAGIDNEIAFGLDRILDGIEALIATRRRPATAS